MHFASRSFAVTFILCCTIVAAHAQTAKPPPPLPSVPLDSVSQDADNLALETYLSTRAVDSRLVQTIDSACAVLIYPDEEQIKALKLEGAEAYDVTVDDGMYYQGMAIEVFNALNVRTVTAAKRFLRFQGWLLDIRKRNLPSWNLILFTPNKEPRVVSAPTLERDSVAAYFDIKEQ